MQALQKNRPSKIGLFFYLILLLGCFVFFEISIFIQGSELYLGEYKYISERLKVPITIVPGILFFIFVQLCVHAIFILMVWMSTRLIGIALHYSEDKIEITGVVLCLISMTSVLFCNQYFFPASKFSLIFNKIVPYFYLKYVLFVLFTVILTALLLAIIGLLKLSFHHRKMAFSFISMAVIGAFFVLKQDVPFIQDVGTVKKPNIIIIGVDSLRPDFLGFFGGDKNTTPNMDAFLSKGAVFSESLSPLARTFPAWISILTGEYPKITNVRTNLMENLDFDLNQTLSAILRNNGYHTIFAMDEVRYSNIDERMGFDDLVIPPIGVNDFLVGTLNDFPMTNLLVNTWLGRYLLPYSYSNRPVYITYDPDTFIKYISQTLKRPRTKPVFLSVHFCLPHYPYSWSAQPWTKGYVFNYRRALERSDQQVADLLVLLKKNKLLSHSIVVLLSDHGEALELLGDRITEADLFVKGLDAKENEIPHFYPPGMNSERVNQSAGHGTDVLGLPQFHTMLAFRFFGVEGQKINIIPGRVSLLDIKPTILDLLGLPISSGSGKSLSSYILGEKLKVPSDNDFFIESDFSPEAVRSVHPETRDVLFQGIDYFQINPKTTRVTVKKNMYDLIISSKQYADFYGPWILALYPQNGKPMIPILVNLETGEWTNDLRTTFAKEAPTIHMINALKKFYGSDIKNIENVS